MIGVARSEKLPMGKFDGALQCKSGCEAYRGVNERVYAVGFIGHTGVITGGKFTALQPPYL